MRRSVVGAAIGLLACTFWPGPGQAQEAAYPNRTVTLVTPYAPGGGSDIVTRVLADTLRRYLGQTVAVRNVSGGGGNIGAQTVARAQADGYTLLSHHIGMATAPALFQDPGFDPVTSFEPIGLFADTPMAIVGNRDLPPNTMAELIVHLRELGEGVTFASSGQGSATHLCAINFQQVAGRNVTMVQYRGAAPALADLQAGRVNLLCDVTAGIAPHIRSGSVKPFVLSGRRRIDSLPQVPTTEELGVPQMGVSAWYGLYAPAGTPQPIIGRLAAALQESVRDPEMIARLAQLDTLPFDPPQATPTALREHLAAQVALWSETIRRAGIPVN
ncbi:Bug family tripartite tricarboxylate transporter substrate binding protein [Siccirubricoccus phaeus]|uniref:Bug family tripartite tricarboxylate transporter substrate binding protein n=1 Tax=Siccirubricoccus phaeus TaxID=2595053 RepID=UPI00165B5ABE|nr:tripartite tricarboxylate transporter substrate-binding protein [Siccirubricoccus phaeus]